MASIARTPLQWSDRLSAPPVLSSEGEGWSGAILRRWTDVAPEIDQPALTHPYISVHLGGPKRLTRWGEGRREVVDSELGDISIIPAGTAYAWSTEGPIDFAHLYLSPGRLEHVAVTEFDRAWRDVELRDRLGVTDELTSALMRGLLATFGEGGAASALYRDSLLQSLILHLLRAHSSIGTATSGSRMSLAPRRLSRVLEHIEAHLADPLRLDDLAAVAGCSPFHFSRAFLQAKGRPPYAYVTHRRLALARELLREGRVPLEGVAQRSGFGSVRQLSRMFKREFGITPAACRRGD